MVKPLIFFSTSSTPCRTRRNLIQKAAACAGLKRKVRKFPGQERSERKSNLILEAERNAFCQTVKRLCPVYTTGLPLGMLCDRPILSVVIFSCILPFSLYSSRLHDARLDNCPLRLIRPYSESARPVTCWSGCGRVRDGSPPTHRAPKRLIEKAYVLMT